MNSLTSSDPYSDNRFECFSPTWKSIRSKYHSTSVRFDIGLTFSMNLIHCYKRHAWHIHECITWMTWSFFHLGRVVYNSFKTGNDVLCHVPISMELFRYSRYTFILWAENKNDSTEHRGLSMPGRGDPLRFKCWRYDAIKCWRQAETAVY